MGRILSDREEKGFICRRNIMEQKGRVNSGTGEKITWLKNIAWPIRSKMGLCWEGRLRTFRKYQVLCNYWELGQVLEM